MIVHRGLAAHLGELARALEPGYRWHEPLHDLSPWTDLIGLGPALTTSVQVNNSTPPHVDGPPGRTTMLAVYRDDVIEAPTIFDGEAVELQEGDVALWNALTCVHSNAPPVLRPGGRRIAVIARLAAA